MKENELLVRFGTNPFKAGRKLMEESKVWENWKKSDSIGLKPNLVVAKKASSGATTHPEFVAGIIEFLQEEGFKNLTILEGSWVGDSTAKAFKACGYDKISNEYKVPLVDLQKDDSVSMEGTNGDYRICRQVLELDRLINLPVMKGHCQTKMTCALKNLKGCIPDSEKRRFHSEGLYQPIADLNEVLKADLILVDAMNGDPDFEEGGSPHETNMFMAALDPVLMDSYACSLMGLTTEEVPYIARASELGCGSLYSEETIIRYQNRGKKVRSIQKSARAEQLKSYVKEKGACSACYASLMQALDILEREGELPEEVIKIGQKYKGKKVSGPGIGKCLSGADRSAKGCPPTPEKILAFLRQEL